MQIKIKHFNISKYMHKILKKMVPKIHEQTGRKLNVTSAKNICCCQWKFCGIKLAEITCYFIQNDSLTNCGAVFFFI